MLIMLTKKALESARKKIGENLAAARKAAGLSQKELAKKVGCSQGSIAHYEAGRRSLPCEMIKIMASALDTMPPSIVDPSCLAAHELPFDNEHLALAKKAIDVIKSKTHYADSLIMNIESFHAAVVSEKTLEARLAAVERSLQRGGPPQAGQHTGNASSQKKSLPGNKTHR